jgi:predicted nucleotidyltransferase
MELMSIIEIKKKIYPILKKYRVSRASFFGSIVQATATKNSDIDILVELPNSASLLDLAGLKLDLEDKLGKKVDVVTYNSVHPLLKDRILGSQKVIL